MSYSKKRSSLAVVLIVLCCCVVIVALFTSGVISFASFLVDGNRVFPGEALSLTAGSVYTISCEGSSYIGATVVPNRKAPNFDFFVDDGLQSFSNLEDLSLGFDITYANGNLYLTCVSLTEVLRNLYPGKEVELPVSAVRTTSDRFVLILNSDRGSISVTFSVSVRVRDINFGESEVIF